MKCVIAVVALMLGAPATVRAACSVTATPIGFGNYLPFSAAPDDSSGSVAVHCTQLVGSYAVALNAGLFGGGNFSHRQMSSGADKLGYQLYTTAARTTVWGDGTGGTATVSGNCFHACNTSYTIHGRIPARQVARPGTYADVILATVSF